MRLQRPMMVCLMALCCGGAGAQAPVLVRPAGVAYDAAGNLYVADSRRNQVLETILSGATVVVAGTGEQGFAGDGGMAAAALLNGPQAVAVGADGAVYIADTGNERVRVVVAGKIATFAGTGLRGFGGDGGAAIAAKLSGPAGVAVDAGGGLLIADSGNQRVRRVSGGVMATFAGTGEQGFGGDGGAASAALLDTPAGVAVMGDGRVLVADSHNQRLRIVGVDGKIATFAGTGGRGFGGDGGAAVNAQLWWPRGVAVMPDGAVVFADSNNQRLRMVDTSGVISTVAGSGVQGGAAEGTAAVGSALDSPRGVAVSRFAAAVFGDARNGVVREVAAGDLYAVGARAAAVMLNAPSAITYGQGTAAVVVTGAAPAVQGTVALVEGGAAVGGGELNAGTVVVGLDGLAAGTHVLTASYAGDGLHAAAVSPGSSVVVGKAPVVAAGSGATIVYGAALPLFTGTLTGVLPRDAASVGVVLTTGAPDLAGVGTYPLTASLTGGASGNYLLSGGGGLLTVVKAGVSVSAGTPAAGYVGLPVTLSARVTPALRGTPTGVVSFQDGPTVVGTGILAGGIAGAVVSGLGAGTHVLTAVYGGDANFLAGSSGVGTVAIGEMPDFSVGVAGSSTQTVVGGGVASYALQVAGAPGPFSGSVSLSATGLPAGALVSFSPATVVPGSSTAAVTMNVQTVALVQRKTSGGVYVALLVAGLLMFRRRRLVAVLAGLILMVGCGDRQFGAAAVKAPQSFAMTVTGTSTNLAGAVVTHGVGVTLVVQ